MAGTHIHFIDPVGENKTVWVVGYQAVIAIGYLFLHRIIWHKRYYALGGPCVKEPVLLLTNQGACVSELCEQHVDIGLKSKKTLRLIAGSPLNGHQAEAEMDFMGNHQNQLCVLEEGYDRPMLHYLQAGRKRFSALPIYISKFFRDKLVNFTTTSNGSDRAIVPIGIYEKIMPLDILPAPLIKALIIGDTRTAVGLGALELDEEDMSLLTFVCPGKYDYARLLRDCLMQFEKEG